MADSPLGSLPGKIQGLSKFVATGQRETVIDVATFAKKEFLAGPPRSGLRPGAKIGGKPWGVGYKLKGSGSNTTASVGYRGPVHWVNSGTDPHFITPGGNVGSRKTRGIAAAAGYSRLSKSKVAKGKKKAISFGGITRAFAYHKGQKAKPFWPGVKSRVENGAPKILQANVRSNIAKAGFEAAKKFK